MSDEQPRITDKRGQNRRPPEAQPEASLFSERIEVLRAIHAERPLTEEEQSELLHLQALEAELQQSEPQQASEDAPRVTTAFLVLVQPDGQVVATSDMSTRFYSERAANVNDMYSGCQLVVRDIQASITSQHTIAMMQQQMEAARQQAMAAQLNGRGLKLGPQRM